MKNTFILFLVALSFVCSSCNRTPSVEEPDVLKVELKETPVSVSDFFSKVEVIPLETSESTGFRGYYLYIDSGLSHLQAYHVDGF